MIMSMRVTKRSQKKKNFSCLVMENKKLILEVEKRAEIWNPNHHLHHKRARIVEIWNKISARTGFSSNFAYYKSQLDSDTN